MKIVLYRWNGRYLADSCSDNHSGRVMNRVLRILENNNSISGKIMLPSNIIIFSPSEKIYATDVLYVTSNSKEINRIIKVFGRTLSSGDYKIVDTNLKCYK